MTCDFEKVARVQEALEKEAFVGAILKPAAGVIFKSMRSTGRWLAKNPLKAMGAAATGAFTAMDMSSAAGRASEGVMESKLMRGIPPPTQF